MCGRYSIGNEVQLIAETSKTQLPEGFKATYNASPGQKLPVLINFEAGGLRLVNWGILPFWAKQDSKRLINARAETINEKPTFKKMFRHSRCLVPASGYYEWKKEVGGKVPHFICNKTSRLLYFAGIYEPNPEVGPDFAIVTTSANEKLAKIHHRMPAILGKAAQKLWCSDTEDHDGLISCLQPDNSKKLVSYEVSKRVNWTGNDDPSLTEPVR